MSKNILLILFVLCAACQAQTPAPAVTTEISPYVAPSATPDCQPASGVTLEVQRVSSTAAVLNASGLQPGEIPFVFYSTTVNGVGSERMESGSLPRGRTRMATSPRS